MLRIVAGYGRRRVQQDCCADVVTIHSSGSDSSSSCKESLHTEMGDNIDGIEVLEPWAEWISQTTHLVEEALAMAGVDDWVKKQKQAKWARAGQVLKLDGHRWSKRVLLWDPATEACNFRRVGRPTLRWDESFNKCVQHFYGLEAADWKDVALDDETWNLLENEYLH